MNSIRTFINNTHDEIVDARDHRRVNLIALVGVIAISVVLALVLAV